VVRGQRWQCRHCVVRRCEHWRWHCVVVGVHRRGCWDWRWRWRCPLLALALSVVVGSGIGGVVPPHEQMLMGLGLSGMLSVVTVRPWCRGVEWL
jgi:hypothetical protein